MSRFAVKLLSVMVMLGSISAIVYAPKAEAAPCTGFYNFCVNSTQCTSQVVTCAALRPVECSGRSVAGAMCVGSGASNCPFPPNDWLLQCVYL